MEDNYELTIHKDDMIAIASGKGLTEAVKPLFQEIHLFDSYVAGTMSLKDPSVLVSLNEGDKLSLRREASKFDDNEILLLSPDGVKVGYVPEKDI